MPFSDRQPSIQWAVLDERWRVLTSSPGFGDLLASEGSLGVQVLSLPVRLAVERACAQAKGNRGASAFYAPAVICGADRVLELQGWVFANDAVAAPGLLLVVSARPSEQAVVAHELAGQHLLGVVSDAAMILLPSREIAHCNQACLKLLRRTENELRGKTLQDLVAKQDASRIADAFANLDSLDTWDFLSRLMVDDQPALCEIKLHAISDQDRARRGYVAVIHPIFDKQHHGADLIAACDPVTGLLARHEGLPRMEAMFRICARRREPVLVLLINFPGLSDLNRQIGVEAVDRWLKESAKALTAKRRYSDIIFRLDGSNMILVMPAFVEAAVDRFVAAIRASLGGVCAKLGVPVEPSVSIYQGIPEGDVMERLLQGVLNS